MSSPQGNRRYFLNIAWSWLGFAVLFASAAVVTPMLIRSLGTAQFGIWALAISLVEYFWMIDLGLRPATVKISAELHALGRVDDLNRLIATGLAYSTAAGVAVLAAGWVAADALASLLQISHPDFQFLVRAVALSWCFGLIFNVFAAVLEGFQRFDASNRASIATTLARSVMSLVVVIQGYGLREMAIALMISQGIGYAMVYGYCRRVYPEMRLGPRYVSREMAGRLIAYARQVAPGIIGSRLTQGSVPSIVKYFRPEQFVTYFTQSQRILDYAADTISRVGMVTSPRASELSARGRKADIVALTRKANRLCLTIWGAVAAYLFVYGENFFKVWVNEEFGTHAGPLVALLLVGYTAWMGQFISAATLMGVARYQRYSLVLLVEAVAATALFAAALPTFGLEAAAGTLAALMVASRCIALSYLFCSEFGLRQDEFLWDIYARPGLLIAGSCAGLYLCREHAVAGRNWTELIGVGAAFTALYGCAAFVLALDAGDREYVLTRASRLLRRRAAAELGK